MARQFPFNSPTSDLIKIGLSVQLLRALGRVYLPKNMISIRQPLFHKCSNLIHHRPRCKHVDAHRSLFPLSHVFLMRLPNHSIALTYFKLFTLCDCLPSTISVLNGHNFVIKLTLFLISVHKIRSEVSYKIKFTS